MPTVKFADGEFRNKKAVENLIEYIFDSQKTLHNITDALGVYPVRTKTIIRQFKEVQKNHRNMKGRKAYHLIVSFSDNEMMHLDMTDYGEIGYSTASYFWNADHQVAYALHESSDNLHFHFAINAVNFKTGKKYHLQRSDYRQINQYVQTLVDSIINDRQSEEQIDL